MRAIISRVKNAIAAALLIVSACGGGGSIGDDASDAGADDRDAGPDTDGPVEQGVCRPTAGAPLWLEEGESMTATVSCATGADPGPDGFALTGLPAGATYDADTRTLSFSPALDQAAVYRIAISAAGETGELKIGVADRFDDPANVPVVDPAAYPEEYGIPVVFVSPRPTSSSDYQPITVHYGGRSYAVQGKLRGASSLSYPKQSYTLNFDGDHLEDPARGLVDKKKIVLTTTFDDNSYVRSRLTWDLWRALAPTVPVTSLTAALYLDGEYYGIYTLTDHIDDELMDAAGLPEDGNLYKAVNHDANFKLTAASGATKGNLHQGYEKKHGDPEDSFADLDELVTFVATSSDATFAAELAERVEVADFEAWFMLATFLKLNDSAGKNSYLHHSPTTKWHVVPWDFNDSLGQNWYTLRQATSPIDHYGWNNLLFSRLEGHPDFAVPLAARYAAELGDGGAFDLPAVLARIDAIAAEIGASAGRDERRWRSRYLGYASWKHRTDFTSATEELAYVKAWIAERWAVLAAAYP